MTKTTTSKTNANYRNEFLLSKIAKIMKDNERSDRTKELIVVT